MYPLNGVNALLLSMEYDKLTIGLIAVSGSILVATLTYYYTKSIERIKHSTNLKMQAYIDYVKGITGTAMAGKNNDKQKKLEYDTLILDAKARIAIYGSQTTVRLLSDFVANSSEIVSQEGTNRLIKVIQSMRDDFGNTSINDDDIYRLLYNEHPKNNK